MSGVFTKIIKGEVQAYKVYEDEKIFAFLDINPYQLGHTLVVPKVEVDYFVDLPDNYLNAVFKVAKILTPSIQSATDCERVGMVVEGREVPHFHLHLIPMMQGQFIMQQRKKYSEEEMQKMQDKIVTQYVKDYTPSVVYV
jgi:histidine triad (HIT) family protein